MKSFKKVSLLSALFALLFTSAVSSANAQVQMEDQDQMTTLSLNGKVVDAQTAEAVADAEVSVTAMKSGSMAESTVSDTTMSDDNSTMTDEDGTFNLADLDAGSYKVKVKADGYQTWEKEMTLGKDTAKLMVKLEAKQ